MRATARLARRVAAVVAISVALHAVPPVVVACSCAEPATLAVAAREANVVVVVGSVGPRVAGGHAFTVERWFSGIGGGAGITMVGGDGANCGIPLSAGMRLFAVAYRDQDGRFHPSICSKYATLPSEEGEELIAEAERAFGPGSVPLTAPPEPAPQRNPLAGDPPAGVPWEVLFVGGSVALALALFGVIAIVARRPRPGA